MRVRGVRVHGGRSDASCPRPGLCGSSSARGRRPPALRAHVSATRSHVPSSLPWREPGTCLTRPRRRGDCRAFSGAGHPLPPRTCGRSLHLGARATRSLPGTRPVPGDRRARGSGWWWWWWWWTAPGHVREPRELYTWSRAAAFCGDWGACCRRDFQRARCGPGATQIQECRPPAQPPGSSWVQVPGHTASSSTLLQHLLAEPWGSTTRDGAGLGFLPPETPLRRVHAVGFWDPGWRGVVVVIKIEQPGVTVFPEKTVRRC